MSSGQRFIRSGGKEGKSAQGNLSAGGGSQGKERCGTRQKGGRVWDKAREGGRVWEGGSTLPKEGGRVLTKCTMDVRAGR